MHDEAADGDTVHRAEFAIVAAPAQLPGYQLAFVVDEAAGEKGAFFELDFRIENEAAFGCGEDIKDDEFLLFP